METLLFSLSVVFPMLILFVVGYMIKALGWMDDKALRQLNTVNFRIFMCVMLFRNTARMDLSQLHLGKVIVFSLLASGALLIISVLYVNRTEPDSQKRSVLIQTLYRSNYAIFGIHIIESMYGAEATALPSLLSCLLIPLYNCSAIIIIEMNRGIKVTPMLLLREVIKNPLIIGSGLGLIAAAFRLQIPELLWSPINTIGSIGSPIALIVLGAGFSFPNLGKYKSYIIKYCFLRLVGVGLIFIPLAVLIGLREAELASVLGFLITPISTSIHVMTQQLGGDDNLSSLLVVLTSVFSILTIFLWIYLLLLLGLL